MANHPLTFLVCNVATSPFALILQWQKKKGENTVIILEWLFLPLQPRHRILSRPEPVAALVRKGRDKIVETDGTEPADISIPVCGDDYEWLLRHSTAIQEALTGYTGVVHNNRPKGPLGKMLEHYQWIARPLRSKRPAEGPTVFTDAGQKVKRAACVCQSDNQWQKHVITDEPRDNLQTLELKAVFERANRTLKDYLQRQKVSQDIDVTKWLTKVFFTLNYLSLTEDREGPPVVIHHQTARGNQTTTVPGLNVLYKNMASGVWEGPNPVLFIGRGYFCISTGKGPIWVPSKFVRPVCQDQKTEEKTQSEQTE
ncbi:uncharacterized protein LOC129736354 [Falco cherrug]|uniref:uncharacterized protein LOC129736354 n=1 Tax=Falco cherrug TaxID=345164 RepID=UPI00247AFC1A|nr:uncharacterized protein LOC129736354 [Falco cherrug]